MKKYFFYLNFVIIFCAFLSSETILAQLGFCNGNSGDPIFTETFGTGTNFGPELPAGTTNYDFVGVDGPQDGQYTVGSNTFSFGWNLPSDHTPNDTNGKSLIVNASYTAGEFYSSTVNGLCENTTYEFSSWLINILPNSGCGGQGIPVNVQFEIWDITNTNLLASGNTGDIFSTSTPTWQQYALVFQTLPSETAVILKMINNGIGGCGNDLAIDDIVFKSCGDNISINDTANNNIITLCTSQTPYSTTLTVTPDNSVFSSHFYQWEESTNGITWTDIPAENTQSVSLSGINATSYYRAKVAESASNLSNSLCNVTSEVFQVVVNPLPSAPTIECWETTTINPTTCSWEITGTQPTPPTGLECWETVTFNNTTCSWEVTGMQPTQPTLECWETASFNITTCNWEVTGSQPTPPSGLECWEIATFNNTTCLWEVIGAQPIQPIIECWQTTTFNNTSCIWKITGMQPIIETITSDGNSIIVTTSNTGDFLYSINGIDYQSYNVFSNVEGGLYTIYIRARNCTEVFTREHIHFYIPKFFTPNNDGENDTFDLKGIENYSTSEVYIYNRFGKILKTTKNAAFSWNGVYNNNPLPASDYWYVIVIEGQRRLGHFTLKR